jgi:4-oxalocrotonate tautomerase
MPLINVKLVEGVFSPEQKQEIIETLTDAMVFDGENMRSVTWVVVEEVLSGDWGIGGKALTIQDVRDLAQGVPQEVRSWGAPPAVVIVFMVTLAIGGVALATPGSGISAEALASGTLQDDSDISTALGGLRRRPPTGA